MHEGPRVNGADGRDGYSTIYEKTTVDERRKIDRAVVDRDPPTYRGVFAKFRLAEKGVSFTAFYNYARRLRAAAQNYNVAELLTPMQADLNQTLPRLLGDRLIETLLYHEEATPAHIHRLTQAYSSAVTAAIKAHDAGHVFRRRATPSPDAAPVTAAVPTVAGSLDDLSNDELCALADATIAARNAPGPAAPSEISNPQLPNDKARPAPAARDTHNSDRCSSADRSALRIPASALTGPRVPMPDVGVDPDPRREALRQRLRENFKPLDDRDSS